VSISACLVRRLHERPFEGPKENTMKYMVMHKVDADMEAGMPPSSRILQDMGRFVEEGLKSGTFLDGAGLHRSARRVRVEIASGRRTVTKGPLTGKNELLASFAVVRAQTIDDAVEHAARLAAFWGDGEIEVGLVVEPWDLGLVPKPDGDPPGRYLLLRKSTEATERGTPMSDAAKAGLKALEKKMRDAGVLLSSEDLAPSKTGMRLPSGPKDRRKWTDGPFAESKELIAGFSIIQVPSKEAARAWAEAYAAILDNNEVDVRELERAETA
jgi:hypothetical protein